MTELKKVIGTGTIVALTIGSVMGTGMFMGPAIGARIAGNASLISWIILSVVSLYIAACFGELVAMFPKAGGVYEFGKQTYGRFASFIIGWLAWLVGNITTVVLIVVAVDYLVPGSDLAILKIIVSSIFLLVLNLVAYLGMKESSAMVIAFTLISILVVIGVIVPGMLSIDLDNFRPFVIGSATPIVVTLFFIAESFFGWEAAAYLAEETRNPEKVIPKALMFSTLLVAVMGVLLTFTMLGVINWEILGQSAAPLRDFSQIVFGNLGITNLGLVADVISIGVYLTLLGSAAGNIITMPRLILALARDKLFLKQFTAIHPKFYTPYKAIQFQFFACLLILIVGFGKYTTLLSLLVPLGLVMYTSVLLAVPILRFRDKSKRVFKVPFGKIGPLIVVMFFMVLIVLWAINEPRSRGVLGLGGSLVLIGVPLYLLIELYNDPNMITEVNDILAYGTLLTERINLPKKIIKELLTLLGDIHGKSVLEFGCGVGTLTVKLAKAVGPAGTVYATSFSKNHLKITKKRTSLQDWESSAMVYGDVRLIHDLEHTSRVHPDVGYVDAAVSVGMIGYLQDVEKVLKEVNALMPQAGKICFLDYGDFFHVIPNVAWLAKNEEIEKVFRNCGFSVQVKRVKGLFWNYILIYGMKSEKDVAFI